MKAEQMNGAAKMRNLILRISIAILGLSCLGAAPVGFTDLATNHEASELASEFIRSKIHEIVKDPEKAELLSPRTYSFNGKRVPTGHGYYNAFNHEHVHLIDTATTPITRISEKGIVVGDTEHELDVIIFATGFDAMTGTRQ